MHYGSCDRRDRHSPKGKADAKCARPTASSRAPSGVNARTSGLSVHPVGRGDFGKLSDDFRGKDEQWKARTRTFVREQEA